MEVRVDRKPEKRVVSRKIARAILDAEPACRVCGYYAVHAHHLLRRSQGGDDVFENLIPLCIHCHTKFHNGDEEVARCIRHNLLSKEVEYILSKKSQDWLARTYPYGLGSDPTQLGPSAAAAPAANGSDVAPSGSDSGQVSCKRCQGSGHEPPKLETPKAKKGAATFSVKIPVGEQENGAGDLRAAVAKAGERLAEDLGYDAGTPAYYVLTAVLHDWLGVAA